MAIPAPLQHFDQSARNLLPAATTLLLGLAAVVPYGIPHWGALAPPLMLAGIYYWALTRPNLVPPSAAFALGLFQDLVTGAPIGSSALVLVLVQWILRGQQRYLINRPFLLLWAGFAPVVFGAAAIEWAIYAAYAQAMPNFAEGAIRAALGFVTFPVVAGLILIQVHRALGD